MITISEFHITITTMIFFLLIILFSRNVSDAVKASISLCLEVMVPALFPVLFICSLINRTGFGNTVKMRAHKLSDKLFGLSGNCTEAIFLSLTGGYISASNSAVSLYKDGKITRNEAERLVLFFTSPGFSFCVNIAGISCYSNRAIGFIFFLSSILTNILFALIYNIFRKNKTSYIQVDKKSDFTESFILSAKNSSEQIIGICSWVMIFSVIKSLVFSFNIPDRIRYFFSAIGEISTGIFESADKFSVFTTSFFLFFGGICILLQLLPSLKELNIRLTRFVSIRLLQSSACMLITYIITTIYPITVDTSAANPSYAAGAKTPLGSITLLFMCVIFLNSMKTTHSNIKNHLKSNRNLQ